MAHDGKVKEEYAAWIATPRRLRKALDLPGSKREFADLKGVSERSLYRWEKDDQFQALVEQRRMQYLGGIPNAAVARMGEPRPATDARVVKRLQPPQPATDADDPVYDDDGLEPDEVEYLKVKGTLAQMAADGNQGAMDLYLKHYGRRFIEAEQQDANPYADMDDVELTRGVLELIGPEFVSDWLAGQMVDADG